MLNVLVTGATGFIGSNLLPSLGQTGNPIALALRYQQPEAITTNIQTLQVGDIHATTNWQPALQNIHTVIHLAARAHQLNDTAPRPRKSLLRSQHRRHHQSGQTKYRRRS